MSHVTSTSQIPSSSLGKPSHPSLLRATSAPSAPRVRVRLHHVALQYPLFETRPCLRALRTAPHTAPGAVFAGVGLASGEHVSCALPFDVLGLVLAAEQVRRASGAPHLVVLVADAHALAHGAPADEVLARAASYEARLREVALHCGLSAMQVVRATRMHATPEYQRLLQRVEQRASPRAGAYVTREVADIAHLAGQHGGLIKVGWVLQPSAEGARRDERMFDRRFREWVGGPVGFLYTKAGRALDDGRHKVPPYLERDSSRRVCLDPDEDVAGKLAWARRHTSESTLRGVRNHLGAIARTYGKVVRPLSGSVEQRVQTILGHLFDGRCPQHG